MAGIESIKEDFLTCSICTEEYTDPCTLSCQHSFCRKCVTQFLKTRPDSVQSKTIPCAFCRQVTPVPQPTRPVEEWSKQLKPSLMLQGLMDKLQSGDKTVAGTDFCFLCKEVGETTPALSWCSDCEMTLCRRCVKMHLKGPATKKHDLFDLSGGAKVKQRIKIKCKVHEGEQIKYICKDCNKALCQTCCIQKHAKHNHVIFESMVKEVRSVLSEKKRILEQKMDMNIATIRREESRIEELKMNEKKTEEEISSTIEKAITLMRKRGKDLLNELHDVTGKQIAEHQASVKSGQITAQMYQQHCEFIDQALQSESEVDMYDMYQVCLSGALESVRDTHFEKISTVTGKVKFTPSIEPLCKVIAEMGKIDETFTTNRHGIDSMIPVFHDIIDTNVAKNVNYPGPIDLTVLIVGGIKTVVVIHLNTACLTSFWVTKNNKITSRLNLQTWPYRLTKMMGNMVAFTVAGYKILLTEVRPELVLISTLKTRKQYWGLTCLSDSTLAAGSESPPSVDILDQKGVLLKSFTPQSSGLNLIKWPFFLCTTHDGNILVSDTTSKSIYCLTSEGKVCFTYKPIGDMSLADPRGITVINIGDILLANSGPKIIHLTSEGKYIRDVLTSADSIEDPWGLFVDDTNKLYVCDKGKDKCIKVFCLT